MAEASTETGQEATPAAAAAPARAADAWSRRYIPAVFLVGFVFFFSDTRADPDLWGHLRFGLDILHARALPTSDPYSYLTGGQPWINHEWLAEVCFASVYRLAGGAGLVLLKMAVAIGLTGLIYRDFVKTGVDTLPAGSLTMLAAGLFQLGLTSIRPQLFTYAGLVLTLRSLREGERRPSRLLMLGPIFLVWTQCHGGVLAGLAVVALWSLGHAWARVAPRLGVLPRTASAPVEPWLLLVVPSACTAVCLINPYGPGLLSFLLRTATVPRPDISEWSPLPIASIHGLIYLTAVGLLFRAWMSRVRPHSTGLMAALVALVVMPLTAIRHLPLLGLGLGVLGRDLLADWVIGWGRWDPWPAGRLGRRLVLVMALILALAALPALRGIQVGKYTLAFPARAVALLGALKVQGPAVVHFNWGEYVIWHLGPALQVSYDGRRETIYSSELRTRNTNFMSGLEGWDRLLRDPSPRLALLPQGWPCTNLMRLYPGWKILHEDTVAVIFVPAGSALLKTALPDMSRIPAEDVGFFGSTSPPTSETILSPRAVH